MSIQDIRSSWSFSAFAPKFVSAVITSVIPLVAKKDNDPWDYLYVGLVALAVSLGVDTYTFARSLETEESNQ